MKDSLTTNQILFHAEESNAAFCHGTLPKIKMPPASGESNASLLDLTAVYNTLEHHYIHIGLLQKIWLGKKYKTISECSVMNMKCMKHWKKQINAIVKN